MNLIDDLLQVYLQAPAKERVNTQKKRKFEIKK